jgi:hypothetical protein
METNEQRIVVCLRCERFEECDCYIETGLICTPGRCLRAAGPIASATVTERGRRAPVLNAPRWLTVFGR